MFANSAVDGYFTIIESFSLIRKYQRVKLIISEKFKIFNHIKLKLEYSITYIHEYKIMEVLIKNKQYFVNDIFFAKDQGP